MKFHYRSKGSTGNWSEDTIEADNEQAAWAELDKIYGIIRSADGAQTNPQYVQVEIIGQGQ